MPPRSAEIAQAPVAIHPDVIRVIAHAQRIITPSNSNDVAKRAGFVVGRVSGTSEAANDLVDALGSQCARSIVRGFNEGVRSLNARKPASVAVDAFLRWKGPSKVKTTFEPGRPVGPSAARLSSTVARARMLGAREDIIHVGVADALRGRAGPDVLWWHTPNGGHRAMRTASLMKAQGVQSGIPDLLILVGGRLHCLELKNAKGRPSPEQKSMLKRFAAQGALTAVTKSYDAAIEQLVAWGVIA